MALEFKRMKRKDGWCQVKVLPGGGEVIKDESEFRAYDSAGNYLGFTSNQKEAEYMAKHGYSNVIGTGISDLSLWIMWNDAVASGETVLEAEDGTQVLPLTSRVIMSAKSKEDGYHVRLLDVEEFWEEYRDDEYDVLNLKVVNKPLRLE